MEDQSASTKTTRKPRTTRSKPAATKSVGVDSTAGVSEAVSTKVEEVVAETVLVPAAIDPSQYVVVRNGFQGKLIYVSSRTKERFMWDQFGDEQEIELRDLKSARSSSKKFFQNNWFMFDEDWIVDYLGVKQFYKNALKIDEFDSVFENDTDTLQSIISKLSPGQKKSIAYRARQLIASGEIDSIKMITVLEESLETVLIER